MPGRAKRPERVLLGRIAGAHGIRGEVLIRSFTADPQGIAAYGPLSDKSGAHAFEIEGVRATAKGVVARIRGVADRGAAEGLKGTELYVERGRLPATAEDEFYHVDLIGLVAVDREGKRVGEIVGLENYGAGDLVAIKLAGTGATELIPFTEAFVPEVDLVAGHAVVALDVTEADQ